MKSGRIGALLVFSSLAFGSPGATPESAVSGAWGLIPTPQYLEMLPGGIALLGSGDIRIVTGSDPDPRISLAARMLKDAIEKMDPRLLGKVSIGVRGDGQVQIHLADLPLEAEFAKELNFLDQQLLSQDGQGQSYVLRALNAHSLLIAGQPQGILYGAMTLLQLLEEGFQGVSIRRAYIRDYPHFEYRMADFLLNAENNRWSHDRGLGVEGFEAISKRKIDLVLKHKMNMIIFDGFGWSLDQRFPEYAGLMRRLNAYARERGISLLFGGYGASYGMSYQTGPLYEEGAYLGKVFYNRESYPDGEVYSCMGFPEGKSGVDPSQLGSCRANDDLNRLKAEELKAYVEAVEPGALYIHSEDFGGYEGTQGVWRKRDPRCRTRWPDDNLNSTTGGAAGLAHGYSWLVNAVNQVKNMETGYDASRDCRIILASPVYLPDSPSSEDWSEVVELWRNIGKLLPKASNVMVLFREVFPQPFGGKKFTEHFSSVMRASDVELPLVIFFLAGAGHFLNDYPLVSAPIMNALFLGGSGIYNTGGDGYQEPQLLLNAEYSWNVYGSGFHRDPQRNKEAVDQWYELTHNNVLPVEIFGERGFLRRACESLYGKSAALPMMKYYSEHRLLPELVDKTSPTARGRYYYKRKWDYLPFTWPKVYGVPYHWRSLGVDSKTWNDEITNEAYLQEMRRLGLGRPELHGRLKKRWQLILEMSEKAQAYLSEALDSSPAASAREDIEFFLKSTRTTLPMARGLMDFHEAMRLRQSGRPDSGRELLIQAQDHLQQAAGLARSFFPQVIAPGGGEVGTLKVQIDRLLKTIQLALQ